MAAQSPPAKIARFAETDLMKRESSEKLPSIALDLGLGNSSGGLTNGNKCGFTFLQLQELEHQALIFKHMAAGVPVPFHLVLPIWKSLSNSFGALHGGSNIYPSFLGCKGVYFDYRNSMEPEPGRCRRTDGKKWRCSKEVVPDQKYCERHMHRGRNRSRKPVETNSQTQVGSSSLSSNHLINDSNTNLSISIPLQLMTANTTTNTTTTTATTTTTTTNNSNSTEISQRMMGFSPKSVLQSGGGGGGSTHRTETFI